MGWIAQMFCASVELLCGSFPSMIGQQVVLPPIAYTGRFRPTETHGTRFGAVPARLLIYGREFGFTVELRRVWSALPCFPVFEKGACFSGVFS